MRSFTDGWSAVEDEACDAEERAFWRSSRLEGSKARRDAAGFVKAGFCRFLGIEDLRWEVVRGKLVLRGRCGGK